MRRKPVVELPPDPWAEEEARYARPEEKLATDLVLERLDDLESLIRKLFDLKIGENQKEKV